MPKKVTKTITMTVELHGRLELQAASENRSVSNLVETTLLKVLGGKRLSHGKEGAAV